MGCRVTIKNPKNDKKIEIDQNLSHHRTQKLKEEEKRGVNYKCDLYAAKEDESIDTLTNKNIIADEKFPDEEIGTVRNQTKKASKLVQLH